MAPFLLVTKSSPPSGGAQKNVTFRTSLTGLSVLLRNAIVIIFSQGVLQPSGIRRFGNGVSQLSPLRPVLGNGDPLIEILRNALTFEGESERADGPQQIFLRRNCAVDP